MRARARLPGSKLLMLCSSQVLPADVKPGNATSGVSFVAADCVSVGSGPDGDLTVRCAGDGQADGLFDMGSNWPRLQPNGAGKLGLGLDGRVLCQGDGGVVYKTPIAEVLTSGVRPL